MRTPDTPVGASRNILDEIEAALEQMLMGKASQPLKPAADQQLSRIIELVNVLSDNFAEMAKFSRGLAGGNLDIDVPGRRNYLAAPLKELHSQLSSFVWTAQQLQKGHVVEKLDYMGEISAAMNSLIERVSTQGGLPLRTEDAPATSWQYHQMLSTLNRLPVMVFIVDDARRVLFVNTPGIRRFGKLRTLDSSEDAPLLERILAEHSSDENTFPYYTEVWDKERDNWYKVTSDQLFMKKDEPLYLHSVEDISEWKLNENRLQRSATLDSLTGVNNRTEGIKALEAAMASRDQITSCVAFIDVDRLKHINDAYGHNEGDYVIQTIAGAFASSLRDSDMVSRFGGDEFLVVFSGCQIEAAERIINRVQEKIDCINDLNNKPYVLSFSHGLTQIDRHSDLSVKELIHLTDKKMYERKRAKHKAEAARE